MADRRPLNYPRFRAFNGNGVPLEGGTVEFFEAGSTNNRTVYSDPDLTVAAPNPVTLNARGEPESGGGTPIDIYVDGNPYKIVLKDSDGNTVWTIDNYTHDGGDSTVQFVALDLGDDGNDESSGLNRISISNDTNSIATESVADELNFDMSQNWPTADDVPDSAVDHDQTTNFVANEHVDHTTVDITAGTGLSGGGDISASRTLSVDEANVDHDSLQNFVANEHVDHSSVNITAGTGLSGGGDITATRTLDFDITNLTSVTAASGDEIPVADASDTNNTKKVSAQSIADLASGSVGSDPSDATDSGTDAFQVNFGTDISATEIADVDFQSANTTTTPTLENTGGTPGALTITTKDGSALWADALSGVHTIQLASDGNSWLVLDPQPIDEDDMASDSASSVATQQSIKSYVDGYNGAGLVPVSQAIASNDAQIDFTGLDTTYDTYVIYLESVVVDTDAVNVRFRVSSDGGSTFDDGSSDYTGSLVRHRSSSSGGIFQDDFGLSSAMVMGLNQGSASGESGSGQLFIHAPSDSSRNPKFTSYYTMDADNGTMRGNWYIGRRNSAKSIDAVRIDPSSGNFVSGTFRLYGVKKS